MKEDVLKIEFQPVFEKWVWKITYQNTDVLERGEFKDEEIGVKSSSYPCYYQEILWINGKNKGNDNYICFCTAEEKSDIEEKVKLINEKYGIKKTSDFPKHYAEFFTQNLILASCGITTQTELKLYEKIEMTEEETISWIFLSIALASETEPANVQEISNIADGINHNEHIGRFEGGDLAVDVHFQNFVL